MAAADVDGATSALANVSIAAPTDENNASTIAASEGRRLYIGNLAYTTNEAQLKDFFKTYNVESVSIPTNPRTTRAVGYAFVDVATKDEAEKAINELSGKEILERKVSVQIARKPGASAPAQAAVNGGSNGEERGQRVPRGRGGARGGRGGRGRGGMKRRGDSARATSTGGEPAAATSTSAAPAAAETTAAAPATDATATKAEDDGADKATDAAGFRARRKRGPPENGVASTTKVMVANLPYELSEQALKDLFSAYNPESAKIALRPIPRFMVRKLQARGEARKGRGFGFVTLPSEELQKKAVDEMNGKVIEGREIAVKVAIDNPREEEDGEEGAEAATQEAAAPAAEAST